MVSFDEDFDFSLRKIILNYNIGHVFYCQGLSVDSCQSSDHTMIAGRHDPWVFPNSKDVVGWFLICWPLKQTAAAICVYWVIYNSAAKHLTDWCL